MDLVRKSHFIDTLIGCQAEIRTYVKIFKADNISFNYRIMLYIKASIHGRVRLFYLTNNQTL